jgi:transposase
VTQLLPLVEAIPPIGGKRGAPWRKPDSLWADKAYDSLMHRLALSSQGIEPCIPHRRTDEDTAIGKHRWVVERTISWLKQFRRLRVRYEKRADIHYAFLVLACIAICARTLFS